MSLSQRPTACCHACIVGVNPFQSGVGVLGDPFGACKNCNAFVCGFHGTRDANVPQVICVECDPALLAASAVALGQPAIPAGPRPRDDAPHSDVRAALLGGYRHSQTSPEAWAVASVDEFRARRPGYGSIFDELASAHRESNVRPHTPRLRGLWDTLPDQSRQMLRLAALIVRRMAIPDRELSDTLRDVRDSFF